MPGSFKKAVFSAARLLCLLIFSFFSATLQAQFSKGIDEDAKLPFWEWRDESVSVRFVQRLPDQTRAHFMARNFPADSAEIIALNCAFQTIFKNTSETAESIIIAYDLTQWQIVINNRTTGLKPREMWQAEWARRGVDKAAQIAFEWSLIPTKHSYKAGDYNWGMTVFGLPPGTRFDFHLVWNENEIQKKAIIQDIECASDIHPDPEPMSE